MLCDRRNRTQHKALVALLLYMLVWGATIVYAATEHETGDGWGVGNVLILCGIVTGLFTGLIGYIFTSAVKDLKEGQRQDREDLGERNKHLDGTLVMIFNELKTKQDKDECRHSMDRLTDKVEEIKP